MFSPEENKFKDIWVSASHSSIGQIKKSIEENLKLGNKLTWVLNPKYGEVMISKTMADIFMQWIAKDKDQM